MLLRFDDEVKVVMEATGIYHLPVLTYLIEKKIFVSVINPFVMKEYRCQGLRCVKTDKQDAIAISNYGIDIGFIWRIMSLIQHDTLFKSLNFPLWYKFVEEITLLLNKCYYVENIGK